MAVDLVEAVELETGASAPRSSATGARQTMYARYGKRLLDLAVGMPLLLVALVPIAILALLVVATSGWPPFYRGWRLGRGGAPFRIWKLRTMVRRAEQVLQRWTQNDATFRDRFEREFKVAADPRVTRLGAFLRRSSLDELPQLLNVMRGEMSLVGPRPIVAREAAKYGDAAAALLSVAPGLTGAWQVNGRNRIGYPERIDVELAYCGRQSLWGDLAILLRTLACPFRFDGL